MKITLIDIILLALCIYFPSAILWIAGFWVAGVVGAVYLLPAYRTLSAKWRNRGSARVQHWKRV